MNLSPMQLFSQEKILLALYPNLSIDEAKEKEAILIGCLWEKGYTTSYSSIKGKDCYIVKQLQGGNELYIDLRECIGLQPTLPRVLEALGNYCYSDGGIYSTDGGGRIREFVEDRKLLNEDKTDATLRDQTPETQLAIAKLIGREE